MNPSKIISNRTNPTRTLVFILILLGILCNIAVFSQENSTIEVQPDFIFGGSKFYQNYEKLTRTELEEILRSNNEAYVKFQTGRTNSQFGWSLSVGGTVLMWVGMNNYWDYSAGADETNTKFVKARTSERGEFEIRGDQKRGWVVVYFLKEVA